MVDAGSLMMATLLVGFHAAHDENDPTTWATLGRLQRLVGQYGLASPRRLDDLVARFRQTGFVESVPSASDRRMRILKPTDRLLAHDRAYVAALHLPLHVLYPDRGYEPVIRQDARVHLALRRTAVLAWPIATAFIPRHPAIMMLLARDGGYCAFLMVAKTVLSDVEPRTNSMSYTTIARRLGVSRTHVRNLFVKAAAAHHVSLAAQGGKVVSIRPRLWKAFDRFLADMESGNDAIAQMALARALDR